MTSTPPAQTTITTVIEEWWSSAQLAEYLGYSEPRYASRWFARHHERGHFEGYDEPRRALPVRRTEGADARGNRWLYWAPACVEIRERSVRGTSRLAGE